MSQELTGIILAVDLLLVGVTFWTLVLGHWRGAAGGAAAIIGSLPMLGSGDPKQLLEILLWLFSLLGGGTLIVEEVIGRQ